MVCAFLLVLFDKIVTSSVLSVADSVQVDGQGNPSADTSSLIPGPSVETGPRVETAVEPGEAVVSTPHMFPDWLRNLKLNFNSIVVEQCAKKVRDAVEMNHKFEKIQDIREVRLALIHTTLDYIVSKFGGVSKPRLIDMREVASELGFIYPAIFRDEISVKGYGLGGNKGPEGLALQMLDMFRGRSGSRKKKDEGEAEIQAPKKKGKRKMRYG